MPLLLREMQLQWQSGTRGGGECPLGQAGFNFPAVGSNLANAIYPLVLPGISTLFLRRDFFFWIGGGIVLLFYTLGPLEKTVQVEAWFSDYFLSM